MNPLTQSKNTTILPVLIALTLGCFALSPQARAVCQQGCDLTNDNTFLGDDALVNNTTGSNNIAVGSDAMLNNNTGSSNIAVGFEAMFNNKQGSGNIALGYRAGLKLSGNDNIAIANPGVRGEFGTIRIGTIGTQTNAYIAGVSGATVPTGVAVIVDADGHLGTTTSSARLRKQSSRWTRRAKRFSRCNR
jgi:hypothetical protein